MKLILKLVLNLYSSLILILFEMIKSKQILKRIRFYFKIIVIYNLNIKDQNLELNQEKKLNSILITQNNNINQDDKNMNLAINLASIGYHVFFQVSNYSELNQILIKWSHFKSKRLKNNSEIEKLGHLIPLLYLTHEVDQRIEVISTISAYLIQNQIENFTLINLINPNKIKNLSLNHSNLTSSSPTPSSITSNYNNNHHYTQSSSSSSHRPLTTKLNSPIEFDKMNIPSSINYTCNLIHQETYNSTSLPISITCDLFLLDAFNDTILTPLSTIQDLILILKSYKGRIINIWDDDQDAKSGLNKILLSTFQRTNQVLQEELDKLEISVSMVYPPPIGKMKPCRINRSSIITHDPRSLLSNASDPNLIKIFIQHTFEQVLKKEQVYKSITLFNLIQIILETNHPCQIYPVGIQQILHHLFPSYYN